MNDVLGLNLPQQVFALFYAIFWGLVANAQIRWKAFDWPLALAGCRDTTYAQSLARLWRSLLYLNLIPILLFLVIVAILTPRPACPNSPRFIFQVLVAVFAAQSAFAPYRLWLARMEREPAKFFYPSGTELYITQPSSSPSESFRLESRWSKSNRSVAWLYILVAILAAVLGKQFS